MIAEPEIACSTSAESAHGPRIANRDARPRPDYDGDRTGFFLTLMVGVSTASSASASAEICVGASAMSCAWSMFAAITFAASGVTWTGAVVTRAAAAAPVSGTTISTGGGRSRPPRAPWRAYIRKSNFLFLPRPMRVDVSEPQRAAAATRSLLFGLPLRLDLWFLLVGNGTQDSQKVSVETNKKVPRIVFCDGH